MKISRVKQLAKNEKLLPDKEQGTRNVKQDMNKKNNNTHDDRSMRQKKTVF